ncbi:MAG: rhomboid family intramembrane serine protease [Fibrobacterales bacterium]
MEDTKLKIIEKVTLFTGPQKEAFDLSLLLASQEIQHWIESLPNRVYAVEVEPEHVPKCRDVIQLYIAENHDFFILPKEVYPLVYKPQTLLLLLIPTIFFLLETLGGHLDLLHKLGNAHSQKIIHGGEWWRTFTALTLHSGPGHYLSNMVSGFLIFNLIAVRTRIGFWLFGILCSSAFANYLVALSWSDVAHRSIGFSTAVFGGLGLLAVMEMRHSKRAGGIEVRNFAPLLAAVCLVVFMGVGEKSDILAHFYGFLCGALYGILIPITKQKEYWGQLFLVVLGYLLILLSWAFATNFFVF